MELKIKALLGRIFGSFRKWVFRIRILRLGLLYWGPLFSETPIWGTIYNSALNKAPYSLGT